MVNIFMLSVSCAMILSTGILVVLNQKEGIHISVNLVFQHTLHTTG